MIKYCNNNKKKTQCPFLLHGRENAKACHHYSIEVAYNKKDKLVEAGRNCDIDWEGAIERAKESK